MRLSASLLAALLLCASPLWAQQPHVVVGPDRITLHNGEWMPRYAAILKNSLVVPPDSTTVLPKGLHVFEAIEVGGTLKIEPGTIVLVTTGYVLPGGRLDATGTCAEPSRIVIKSAPIDTKLDPFQYGHGIVNFGTRVFTGCPMAQTWTHLAQNVEAGDKALTFDVPEGWAPGDELVIPDTKQAQQPDWLTQLNPPRKERLTIASIAEDRKSVTTTQPASFERYAVLDPVTGALVARIPVANVTRHGLVVTSEDPKGVAGHVIDIGHEATFQSSYVGYVGLGRTTIDDISSAAPDGPPGKNQAGRYGGGHAHHCGCLGAFSKGDLFDGAGAPGKWAFALHGTSHVTIRDAVMVNFPGAGFVTEDGNEFGWTLDHSFIAEIDPGHIATIPGSTQTNGIPKPGAEGSGIWLTGLKGATITNNEVWDTRFAVALLPQMSKRGLLYASQPGGPRDTPFNAAAADSVWKLFDHNVFGANRTMGLDYWGVRLAPIDHAVIVNGHGLQIGNGAVVGHMWFRDLTVIGGDVCSHSAKPYLDVTIFDRATLRGCRIGISDGGGRQTFLVRDTTIQASEIGIDQTFQADGGARYERVKIDAPIAIKFGQDAAPWQPGQPVPGGFSGPYNGGQHVLIDWQGSGKDYRLFEPQQARDVPAWTSPGWLDVGCPEPRLTMGQCFDRYGLAWRGGVYDPKDAIAVPGVVGGVGIAGAEGPIGPPRFVLNSPAQGQVFAVGSGEPWWLFGAFTGDRQLLPTYTDADQFERTPDALAVQFDNGPVSPVTPYMGALGRRGMGYFRAPVTPPSTPGTHTVTTMRFVNGVAVPGSELTASYVIGAASPEPKPDPIPCKLGPWGNWTLATETDKELTLLRTREIVEQAQHGGSCSEPRSALRLVPLEKPTVIGPASGQLCVEINGKQECWPVAGAK